MYLAAEIILIYQDFFPKAAFLFGTLNHFIVRDPSMSHN